jgi:hypothetical protein
VQEPQLRRLIHRSLARDRQGRHEHHDTSLWKGCDPEGCGRVVAWAQNGVGVLVWSAAM